MALDLRFYGDPVLKQKTPDVADIDAKLAALTHDMVNVMYAVPGIGLAAPQIGVQKRVFVYDLGDGPRTLINPVIKESAGEWTYDEGCLSIPGLYVEILRPKQLLVTGFDVDGNEVTFEADDLLGRVIQHELDHLDGVLMFDRMTPEQRKAALGEYRRLQQDPEPARTPAKRLRLG